MNRPTTKVIYGRTSGSLKTQAGSHLTIVEATPGKFELVGNGPISVGGKILTQAQKFYGKVKAANVISVSSGATAASSSATLPCVTLTQSKSPSVQNQRRSATPTTNNQTEVLSD